ncbi:SulP family inorganic anion transporter [Streptomyces sp. RP5T]|uniref:SulP family inorganic anion transporter n=1 Tax=Streptomyces sp. RP5T TaxID=2490848 RepID=UPI000F6533E8|nr:SulP family inorganic anion transporter [Streptomyces sp. RP5T]RRR87545.1 STAS domain-containing protein [Streptomyces sp. RP5T]
MPADHTRRLTGRRLLTALPVAEWVRGYRRGLLRGDVLAGLTVWALIVPESVAYAEIAGVPPQNAFYAAPIALVGYALLGGSRFLVVGATSAAAVLSASTVKGVSGDPGAAVGLSAALAVIVGAVLVVAGAARLGFLTNFLAEPALVGFLFGMALTIMVRQTGKILGVSSGEGDFFQRLVKLLSQTGDWSWTTIAVGVAAVGSLLLLERLLPRLPASLIVLAAGLILSQALHLSDHGVQTVGRIPAAVPVPHLPGISSADWAELAAGSLGVALVVFAESYSIAGRFARLHGHEVKADREMVAMGAVNLGVGFFRGFAVSGSASRSAAAEGAGGRSPMVSLVAAGLVLLTGAFLTSLFTPLPEAVLGAIVIVAVKGFLRVGELRRYATHDRPSLWIAVTALVGVLVFDLLPGLLLAVLLSLLLFIAYSSTPRVAVLGLLPGTGVWGDLKEHPRAVAAPGILVARPDGALFFGNVNRVRTAVKELVAASDRPPRAVVVDLTASYRLGLPVLDTLADLAADLDHQGVELHLARVRARPTRALSRHPLHATLSPDRLHPTVTDAVDALSDGWGPA